MLLDQAMAEDFSVQLEDGSAILVAKQLVRVGRGGVCKLISRNFAGGWELAPPNAQVASRCRSTGRAWAAQYSVPTCAAPMRVRQRQQNPSHRMPCMRCRSWCLTELFSANLYAVRPA